MAEYKPDPTIDPVGGKVKPKVEHLVCISCRPSHIWRNRNIIEGKEPKVILAGESWERPHGEFTIGQSWSFTQRYCWVCGCWFSNPEDLHA